MIHSQFSRSALRWGLLCGLAAATALAQTSSFGQAAHGAATEVIAIAKWVGIILCIFCGFGLMTVSVRATPSILNLESMMK